MDTGRHGRSAKAAITHAGAGATTCYLGIADRSGKDIPCLIIPIDPLRENRPVALQRLGPGNRQLESIREEHDSGYTCRPIGINQ